MTKAFWPGTAGLLLLMAGLQISSMRQESQTFDEATHIVAGYSYWKTGDFRLNPEHPPLMKLLASAPLLFVGLDWNPDPNAWRAHDPIPMVRPFVYQNKIDADRLLLLARLPMVGVSLLLGLAIALLARREFGPEAGLIALAIYATDANFLAHGRYVTNDVLAAAAYVVSAFTWLRALETDRRKDWAVAALALGLALTAKFSTLFLLPVHIGLAVWKRRLHWRWILAAFAVVAVVYAPDTLRIASLPPLANRIPGGTPLGDALKQVSLDFHLPAHGYLDGVYQLVSHNSEGHRSYLMGIIHEAGDWRYFPVAFLVKSSSAFLLLLAVAVFRVKPALWMVYPVVYFAIALCSSLNLGVRHILPVFPFLFLFIAGAFQRRLWPVFALAAVIHAYELGHAAPYYTAFFNVPSGGPANGHYWLLDSNIDWGQDAKRLGQWMKDHQQEKMCVSYFGMADLLYYGVWEMPLAGPPPDPGCYAAVSVNNLHDLYTPAGTHRWLEQYKPVDNVGHSMLIYDLRKDKSK